MDREPSEQSQREQNAGVGSSIPDEAYVKAGGKIVATKEEIWAADMVVKVKEPIAPEYALMRKDLLLFTYLHLAAAHELGKELIRLAKACLAPAPKDRPFADAGEETARDVVG